MKKIICFIIVLATIFSGCSNWEVEIINPEESLSTEDKTSSTEEEGLSTEEQKQSYYVTEDMISLDAAGLFRYKVMYYSPFEGMEPDDSQTVEWTDSVARIFIYEPYQCEYEVFEYRAENIKATVNQLVKATINRMNRYIPEGSFEVSVRAEKSMAIVDFYNTTESFWSYLDNEKTCSTVLNSVAMTLIRGAGFESVGFTAEGGGQFETASVTLDNDGYGYYIPEELYGEISDGEFAVLRALCEYDDSWKNELPAEYGFGNVLSVVYDDAVELRPEGMDILLAYAGYTGEFDSPEELSDEVKISAAMDVSAYISTASVDEGYVPGFEAISAAVDDEIFIPKEWVEKFVENIFGPDAKVEHTAADGYTYHAKVGVYTPPHRGGWADYFPYVFSVSETDGGYEAEVAYIYIGMTSYGVMPGFWHADFSYDYENLEDDPAAMDFIENKAPRFRVTLKRTAEGELYMASSEKILAGMSDEYREIAAKYIAPIHYLAVNETWSDPNEISGKGYYFSYFSMAHNLIFGKGREAEHYGIEDGKNPFGRGEKISAEEMEGTLAKHFEGDFSSLRDEYYDGENETYYAPEHIGFGGAVFPYVAYVTETKNELAILFDLVNESGNIFATKELRIDISDQENWKYIGCYDK